MNENQIAELSKLRQMLKQIDDALYSETLPNTLSEHNEVQA